MQSNGGIKINIQKYVFQETYRLLAAIDAFQNDHCCVSFLSFYNISIVFCTKSDLTTIDVAKWMFNTLRCLWSCNMGFLMFLYCLHIGLNLAKYGINSF